MTELQIAIAALGMGLTLYVLIIAMPFIVGGPPKPITTLLTEELIRQTKEALRELERIKK